MYFNYIQLNDICGTLRTELKNKVEKLQDTIEKQKIEIDLLNHELTDLKNEKEKVYDNSNQAINDLKAKINSLSLELTV